MFGIRKHVLQIFASRFGKENRIVAAFLSLVFSIGCHHFLLNSISLNFLVILTSARSLPRTKSRYLF